MAEKWNRRQVLACLGAVGLGALGSGGVPALARTRAPQEKLNLAVVGCGGQGLENLRRVSGENIVALCDVDERRAAKAFKLHPNARRFCDDRKLFDALHGRIDAVVVSTPYGDAWQEGLRDNTRSPADEAAAFRCDFPCWLATLAERDRRLVEDMTLGHRTVDLAIGFRISPGRVSQLWRSYHTAWRRFHGERSGAPGRAAGRRASPTTTSTAPNGGPPGSNATAPWPAACIRTS